MRISLATSVFALVAPAFAAAFPGDPESLPGCRFFTVATFDANLRVIDGVTGVTMSSVPMTTGEGTIQGAVSLAQGPNALFVVLRIEGLSRDRRLSTVDPATGVTTTIGNLGDNFSSITFTPDGRLFGVTGDGGFTPETLFEIDPNDASTTEIASLGIGDDGEVIAFDPSSGGLLHASGSGRLNDPEEGLNLSVLFPDRLRSKSRRLSGFETAEISALRPLPGGAVLAANIDGRLITIDRKGFITEGPTVDHSNCRGLVPLAPAGSNVGAKIGIKLNFAAAGSDAVKLQLSGLDLGPFDAAGATVAVDIGNVGSGNVTLDGQGRFVGKTGSLTMTREPSGNTWKLVLSAKDSDLQDLRQLGFVDADTAARLPLCLRFRSGAIEREILVLVSYKAKQGKTGSAK
ncbi:MAG: hypothetical protein JNM84_00330 [Planctomycetes bacterium]|nr:hypothetical protein [Planctomycetota bacterium]